MKVPFYRCVRDTDDGCGVYQCLQCGETWEWRGGSGQVRFCLFCGCAIEKLETRDTDTPGWLYEWQKRHGDRHCIWERTWRRDPVQQPYWIVENRCIWLKDGQDDHLNHDWKFHSQLRHRPHVLTAREAHQELLRLRDVEAKRDTPQDPDYDPDCASGLEHCYRYEYRLRRETP
jgi:hypothetical protein